MPNQTMAEKPADQSGSACLDVVKALVQRPIRTLYDPDRITEIKSKGNGKVTNGTIRLKFGPSPARYRPIKETLAHH